MAADQWAFSVHFFRERPELETAGWLERVPLRSVVHRDRWGG